VPETHPVPAHVETARPSTEPHAEMGRQRLSRHELGDLRHALVSERARLTGVVEGLREQSLLRHDEVNHEEDGTDAFIRLFDLDRASNEQAQIVKIDAAIRAIDEGAYGICERCSCRIEKPRLQALPFAKTCIKCQSEAENGHRGRVSARHRLWE
jgi:DnaK suppressor protein